MTPDHTPTQVEYHLCCMQAQYHRSKSPSLSVIARSTNTQATPCRSQITAIPPCPRGNNARSQTYRACNALQMKAVTARFVLSSPGRSRCEQSNSLLRTVACPPCFAARTSSRYYPDGTIVSFAARNLVPITTPAAPNAEARLHHERPQCHPRREVEGSRVHSH